MGLIQASAGLMAQEIVILAQTVFKLGQKRKKLGIVPSNSCFSPNQLSIQLFFLNKLADTKRNKSYS